MAGVGQRMISGVAKRMAGQFFAAIDRELTSGAPRHDWLALTGGAIGDGLPMAVGAAVACPDRPVIGIQADGSAMYTISALWSHAREQADVTTVVCDNGSYAILAHELEKVGADGGGERAQQLLEEVLDRRQLLLHLLLLRLYLLHLPLLRLHLLLHQRRSAANNGWCGATAANSWPMSRSWRCAATTQC